MGLIDELRISDQLLTPDQFLNANVVPEPASLWLGLSGLGITAGHWWKRRRRATAVPLNF